MNLHLKTGLGNKNYVLDPNSDVENEFFLTDFLWQFWAKNTKINFSSESVKTKEHKESNSCDKYHFSINAFYKINLWPILKKLLQKIDFHHFPLFEIIAHILIWYRVETLANLLQTLRQTWLNMKGVVHVSLEKVKFCVNTTSTGTEGGLFCKHCWILVIQINYFAWYDLGVNICWHDTKGGY